MGSPVPFDDRRGVGADRKVRGLRDEDQPLELEGRRRELHPADICGLPSDRNLVRVDARGARVVDWRVERNVSKTQCA